MWQERKRYLEKFNEIEDERRKVEEKKLVMGQKFLRSRRTSEETKCKRDQLCIEVRRLMAARESLSSCRQQLQVIKRSRKMCFVAQFLYCRHRNIDMHLNFF